MLELFVKGGPVMGILGICSIVGVYIIIQKILYLKASRLEPRILKEIEKNLKGLGKEATIKTLLYKNNFSAELLATAIRVSEKSKEEIRDEISERLSTEIPRLEKNVNILSTIVTVAPILGLLGTVLGLMGIFNVISGGGIGDTTQLSGGIAEALITTVTGLSVAIPFMFGYHVIRAKIEARIQLLETQVNHIIKLCKKLSARKPTINAREDLKLSPDAMNSEMKIVGKRDIA